MIRKSKEEDTFMADEVVAMLRDDVPTARQLARRRRLYEQAITISSRPGGRPGPSAEEILREDRDR